MFQMLRYLGLGSDNDSDNDEGETNDSINNHDCETLKLEELEETRKELEASLVESRGDNRWTPASASP